MKSLRGVVSKIRVLKMSRTPLVRFSLDGTNCLIAAHSLNFLADVDEGMQVVVAGEFNDRKQFVVKKYSVIGKTKIMIEFESSFTCAVYVNTLCFFVQKKTTHPPRERVGTYKEDLEIKKLVGTYILYLALE